MSESQCRLLQVRLESDSFVIKSLSHDSLLGNAVSSAVNHAFNAIEMGGICSLMQFHLLSIMNSMP